MSGNSVRTGLMFVLFACALPLVGPASPASAAGGAERTDATSAITCLGCWTSGEVSISHNFFAGPGCEGIGAECRFCESHGCHSGAMYGPCSDWHHACGPGVDMALLVREVTDAASDSDAEGLGALLRQYPAQVEVNAARGMVQVLGCSGQVLAGLPLEAAVLGRLTTPGAGLGD